MKFLELAKSCQVVVCCRAAPVQKVSSFFSFFQISSFVFNSLLCAGVRNNPYKCHIPAKTLQDFICSKNLGYIRLSNKGKMESACIW